MKLASNLFTFLSSKGFFHEQSREDRNNFVMINWENILEGKGNLHLQDFVVYILCYILMCMSSECRFLHFLYVNSDFFCFVLRLKIGDDSFPAFQG